MRFRGFSLIKLLIAVAISGMVLAIVVPNIFAWRTRTTENDVSRQMQAIHQAQRQYLAKNGHYSATLDGLGATGTQHGYVFTMARTEAGFTVHATPQPYYGFARRTVQIDQTGIVRYTWGEAESPESK